MVFLVNLIATVGFWCGSFFYFILIGYPLSILPFFNAQTLDYHVDNQAFVGFKYSTKNFTMKSLFKKNELLGDNSQTTVLSQN
jgi:hypothetical protein